MRGGGARDGRGALSVCALRALAAAALTLPLLAGEGSAQLAVFTSDAVSLGLSGYVRTLTGAHDAGVDLPSGNRRSAFHTDVARLKWQLRASDRWLLAVHSRIQMTVSSADGGLGGAVSGFGVSAVPGRSVDLETFWVEGKRVRVWHDIDRLALTVYSDAADVTVGRQAITWGLSLLFPTADLWAQFSPFELDAVEKPGTDALRILAYPGSGFELDAVVADRGADDGISMGLRASWSVASADIYGAVGRLWNEAAALAGVAWPFDTWALRAEALSARDLQGERWLGPRVTVGIDRLGSRVALSAEYHYNGIGAAEPRGYLARLRGQSFAQGESYFLGRHYLGGVASRTLDEEARIRLAGSILVNLGDPSAALLPSLSWDVGASGRLAVGGLLGLGAEPALGALVPALASEFGTYGTLGYAEASVYF